MRRIPRTREDGPAPRPVTIGDPDAASTVIASELRQHHATKANRQASELGDGHPAFLEWAASLLTAKGKQLDFDQYPFQREIYAVFGDADVKDAILMKSVQVGASELLVRLNLYLACVRVVTTLYVFPASKQMRDFADSRIDPLLEWNRSHFVSTGDRSVMNKGLKKFGKSFCYFRGSESRNDLISVDADLLVLDEYDSLDPANVPEAERRISASELGLIRRVGVPSDPEYGIAKLYDESDQRRWHVLCVGCHAEQLLSFEGNVRWDENDGIENARIVCQQCEKQLDVCRGRWVAQYPGCGRKPSFHVHRLMNSNTDLVRLIEASKKLAPYLAKSFFNNDLGLPYGEETGGLDRLAIDAAIAAATDCNGGVPLRMMPSYSGPNLVTAGIDVASTRELHVRVSERVDDDGRKRALYIGTADSFEEVAHVLERYGVHYACIDAAPEGRLSRALACYYPGRVYVVRYVTRPSAFNLDDNEQSISVDRTTVFDQTIELLRAKGNLLPADIPVDYVQHMVAVRRRLITDQFGGRSARYDSRGSDDYFHAEVYDVVATQIAIYRSVVATMSTGGWEVVPISEVVEFAPVDLSSGASADSFENSYSEWYDPDLNSGLDDGAFDGYS